MNILIISVDICRCNSPAEIHTSDIRPLHSMVRRDTTLALWAAVRGQYMSHDGGRWPVMMFGGDRKGVGEQSGASKQTTGRRSCAIKPQSGDGQLGGGWAGDWCHMARAGGRR